MKSKLKYVVAVIVFFSFLATCTSVSKKEGWEGRVEKVDGVEIIHNPEEPLHGEIELELEEDLVIGGEEFDENANFSYIRDIEVDDEGNILVLDYRDCRIQKYDKDGKYLQTIGRKGEGPGEFQRPSRIYLAPDSKLYVNEIRRVHIFDQEGAFEKSLIPESPLLNFSVAQEGSLLARSYTFAEEGRSLDIVLMDSEGKKKDTVVSFPDPGVMITKPVSGGGAIAVGGSPPYSPGLFFCPLDEGFAAYGYSSEYKLFVANSAGEVIRRIEKEEERQPTSKKEEDEYINERRERAKQQKGGIQWSEGDLRKLHSFAEYKPFYTNIIMDDEGHLFLSKPKSVVHPEDYTYFDFFNEQGYYLYKIKISGVRPRVIQKGCIYTFGTDPDTGYYEVERYRIKNWDQIKK